MYDVVTNIGHLRVTRYQFLNTRGQVGILYGAIVQKDELVKSSVLRQHMLLDSLGSSTSSDIPQWGIKSI